MRNVQLPRILRSITVFRVASKKGCGFELRKYKDGTEREPLQTAWMKAKSGTKPVATGQWEGQQDGQRMKPDLDVGGTQP